MGTSGGYNLVIQLGLLSLSLSVCRKSDSSVSKRENEPSAAVCESGVLESGTDCRAVNLTLFLLLPLLVLLRSNSTKAELDNGTTA